jgi:protein-L-isoaspartate O-methyltransferase
MIISPTNQNTPFSLARLVSSFCTTGFGVIHSTPVEEGFRRVDRRFFVPSSLRNVAHSDQPLRQGAIHVSAPHIYGTILEALELTPNTSLSFLNAGSGTGYLSSMVAVILGPTSLSINVDCHAEAIAHSKAAVDEWKASIPDAKAIPDMQFLHGNVLNMDVNQGECLRGFDRIYVGAALEKGNLAPLASLLKVGGILVGPGKFRIAWCLDIFGWGLETSERDQGLTHSLLNVYPFCSR